MAVGSDTGNEAVRTTWVELSVRSTVDVEPVITGGSSKGPPDRPQVGTRAVAEEVLVTESRRWQSAIDGVLQGAAKTDDRVFVGLAALVVPGSRAMSTAALARASGRALRRMFLHGQTSAMKRSGAVWRWIASPHTAVGTGR